MTYQQVQLSDLRTSIALRWESTPYWTNGDMDDAINEALRVWNMLTGYWKTTLNITSVANQHYYELSTNLTLATTFSYLNNPMAEESAKGLDNGRPTWQGENVNTGLDVPSIPKNWVRHGCRLIAIWPALAANGLTIVAEGVAKTPVLTNANDYIDIGQDELAYIEGYALHRCSFKLGGDIWKSTFKYYREFIEGAAIRSELLKASSFYRKVMGANLTGDFNKPRFPSQLPQAILSSGDK